MTTSIGEPPRLAALRQSAADAFAAGRYADSLASAQAALDLAPGDYDALHLAVMAALHGGDPRQGLAHAQALVAAHADDAYAHNSHGAALQVLGQLDAAMAAYRRACDLDPALGDSWLNLGLTALQAGRLGDAVASLAEAARLQPRNVNATANLAVARTLEAMARGDPGAAVAPASEAARLAPQSPEVAMFAASAELDSGHDFAAAQRHLARGKALEPAQGRWPLLEALAWPPMLASRAEAEARMAQAMASLEALVAEPRPIQDPFREVGRPPFYSAYAGVDDTALQERVVRAHLACCPSLGFRAAHVDGPPPGFRRIRLGILSAYLNNHTIGKLNLGLVQHWDRKRFEVIVIRPPGPADEIAGFFDEAADGRVGLPHDLRVAREQVAALKLDALFYPDVGMDAFTYLLAMSRLAAVQFTTWGHPVTTAMPHMDFFVSHRHAEPGGAERCYREKLVRFDNLPSFYHPPRSASDIDMRARLGLAAGQRLYACPQTLFKFHPDQDAALCEVLRRDPHGVLVLIASRHSAWNETLRKRLAAVGPDVIGRVRFVEAMSLPDFFALVREADALLDTFWFGGGNSSYEAFGHGRPVVTLPAPMMRGRVTHAWYRQMGEERWIARDAVHYVELAVQLANDDGARREARARVEEGARRILGNVAVVREYEAFVERALRERR